MPGTDRVRERVLAEHRAFCGGVLASADGLDGPDADALRSQLGQAGLLDRAPAVLADCVGALGRDLPHEPVAAPPYVVVTSEGLLLRATFDDCRLVVAVAAFERRDGAWRRVDDVDGALRVAVR